MDLQNLSDLVGSGGQGHMVHFAGVGHPVVITVHLELQSASHRECLSTGIYLLGTFMNSCEKQTDQ